MYEAVGSMESFTMYCNFTGSPSEPTSGIARLTRPGKEPPDCGPLIRQGPPLADRILLIDNVKLESISCELCHQIFEEPTVAGMCGHCFCKACLVIYKSTKASQGCPTCGAKISKSSGLPNRSLSTIIDSQRRFCVSRYIFDCSSKKYVEMKDGCMFVGSFEQMVEHEAGCAMMAVECPQSSCRRLVLRKDLEEHSKAECWRQCEQCGVDIQIGQQEKHLKEDCPETKLSCPRSDIGCHIVVKRRARAKHLESCPYERYRIDLEALRNSLRKKDEEIARLRGRTDALEGTQKREAEGVLSEEETPSKRARTGEVSKVNQIDELVAVSPDSGWQAGDVHSALAHMVESVEQVLLSGLAGIMSSLQECSARVVSLEASMRQRESRRRIVSEDERRSEALVEETNEVVAEPPKKKGREEAEPVVKVKAQPNGSLEAGTKSKAPMRPAGRIINLKKERSAESEDAKGSQGVKNGAKAEGAAGLKKVKEEQSAVAEQDTDKRSVDQGGNGVRLRQVKKERSPSVARSVGVRHMERHDLPGRTSGWGRGGQADRAMSEQRHERELDWRRDREQNEERESRTRAGRGGHWDFDRKPEREALERGHERGGGLRARRGVDHRLEEPGSASSCFNVTDHEHGPYAEGSSPKVEKELPAHPSLRCLSFWFRAIDLVSRLLARPTPQQGKFISSVVALLREMQHADDFRALSQPSSNVDMLEALQQLAERVQCLIDGRVDYSPEATHTWKVAMDSVPEGLLVYDNVSLIKLEKLVFNKLGGIKYEKHYNEELRRAIDFEKQLPNLPLKKSVLLNAGDVSPGGSGSLPPGFHDRFPLPPPQRPLADRIGPRPGGRYEHPDQEFRRPRDMSPTPSFHHGVRDNFLDPRDARRQSEAEFFLSRRSPHYSVFDLDM